MSDEVGVDVERIKQLASALDNLRDVLAANVPVIVSTMNQYWSSGTGQPISLLALQQAVGKSADDASATTARAQMAVTYQDQADTRLPHGEMVNIPWDGSGFGEAGVADPAAAAEVRESGSAANLASELAAAEKNPDPATARAQIQAIERQLQANSGNKTFLAAFWSQPGAAAEAANLASVLSQEDSGGSSLSKTDRQILSGYAGSLAAACRLGALDNTQGKDLVAAFTAATAKNPWSAAMLLSSGPSGAAYGTAANGVGANLLTGATEQALQLQRPSTSAPKTRPDLTDILTSGEPAPKSLSSADYYAALNALLRVDTQNTTAAQQVMAGYNPVTGRFDAKQATRWASALMSEAETSSGIDPEMPDGPFLATTAKVPPQELANFFDAATSGPREGGRLSSAQFSTRAAYDIILGTPDPQNATQSDYVFPGQVRGALLNIFGRYLPDLACSSGGTSPLVEDSNGVYQFRVDNAQLSGFIRQIAVDPEYAGTMQGALSTAIGNAYGMQAKGIWSPFNSDLASAYASLYGDVITQEQNLHYGAAQARDARNAELNALVSLGESIPTVLLPDGGPSAAWADAGILFPLLPKFSVTNASTQAGADLNSYASDQYMLYWPMVQGLINQGVIPPPAGQTWYTGKPPHLRVIPNGAFQNWVGDWKSSNGSAPGSNPNDPKGGPLWNFPGYSGPTGKALRINTVDNQTLEQAWETYQNAMGLARQEDTEEGN
jgi:hypothetical protein